MLKGFDIRRQIKSIFIYTMTVIDELIQRGNLSPELANEIIQKISDNQDLSIDDLCISGGVDPLALVHIREKIFNIPVRQIDTDNINFEILKYVPQESVERYRFVPLAVVDNVLEVGIVDPEYTVARDAISFISSKLGFPYKLFLISKPEFDAVLAAYKGLGSQVTQVLGQFSEDTAEDKKNEKNALPEEETQDLDRIVANLGLSQGGNIVEDAPITKIVAAILKNAIEGGASDIHMEPVGEKVQVRFRVDGVLSINLELPKTAQQPLIARVKILSNLRLDEKHKPTIMEVTENIETSNNEDSIDIRYQEQILKAIKSADLPGPDFFEFSEAVKKLKSSNSSMSLDDIIKNTYIVLSANGLSKNKILETGEHYINVLKTEKNKFEEAVQQGAKNKIEIPQSEIDELCKLNLELENQLNQIQEKINNNELLIKRKKEDIENTKQKLSLNKTKFKKPRLIDVLKNNEEKTKGIGF
jgi:hypothetical protein